MISEEFISRVVESKRLLVAATSAPLNRLRVLVTENAFQRLEAWDGIEWCGDPLKTYAQNWIPGQVGELCGMPVFIRELPPEIDFKVQAMREGLPLNYGLAIPS